MRVDRKVSRDLAVAIQRVWTKALLLTSYPATIESRCWSSIKDGTRYQFSVFARGLGTLEGQTHSPERGLPRELTNIGLDLIAFARQDAKGKTITEETLVNRLKKMEATIPITMSKERDPSPILGEESGSLK